MNYIDVPGFFRTSPDNPISLLKSQRFALKVQQKRDYSRALGVIIGQALVPEFTSKLVEPIVQMAASGQTADTDADWDEFERRLGEHLPDVEQGTRELLEKGVSALCTHHDRSSEMPQEWSARDRFMPQMAKQFGRSGDNAMPYAASMLVEEGVGEGITLSAHDQAQMGLVCSSDTAFTTSAGNAATAPMQQAFLILMASEEGETFNLASLLIKPSVEKVAHLLGISSSKRSLALLALDYDDVPGASKVGAIWLGCLRAVINGEADMPVNEGIGRGLSVVRLPVDDGYLAATPLLNMGLLRDIHQSYFNGPPSDEDVAWRRIYHRVFVGGSKPQNAGTMYSSVISKGRVNSLNAGIFPQKDVYRWVRLRVESGKPLFRVDRDDALQILSRKALRSPEQYGEALSSKDRNALRLSASTFAETVCDFFKNMAELSFASKALFSGAPNKPGPATSESALIHGLGCVGDLDRYVKYLAVGVFNHGAFTHAEKLLFIQTIRTVMCSRLGL